MTIKKREWHKEIGNDESGYVHYEHMVCGRVSDRTAQAIARIREWDNVDKGAGRYFCQLSIRHSKTRTLFSVRSGLDI